MDLRFPGLGLLFYLSPAASLLCAFSLHHHSGHAIPEFGSLFAIDLLRASSLPAAEADNASDIMRHGSRN
jgi:hypothetical protein